MLVIVDWRNVAKNLSHSIRSGAIPCIFATEVEEIAHRMAKWVYCLRTEYKDAVIIFANDVPAYWRTAYMEDWYQERQLEPVAYKGNRSKQEWVFATSKEDMELLYTRMLHDLAKSVGGIVIEDEGLEADDIWGILTATNDEEIVGISTDSDWAQRINSKVKVFNFATGVYREPFDIRAKWIGGDSGDNVPGCPKYKKDGSRMEKNWGFDGAAKELAKGWNPGQDGPRVDMDYYERNRVLTTLPCPLWDANEMEDLLIDCAVKYEPTDELWEQYSVTESLRERLKLKAERDAFLERLRLHFLSRQKTENTETPNEAVI